MAPKSVLCLLTLLIGAHCSVLNRGQLGVQPAGEGQFPWLAVLYVRDRGLAEPDNQFMCAGSLISTSHVLTAAHCVYGIQEYTDVEIFLGDYENSTQSQLVHPDKIILHKDYDTNYIDNDIALLRLPKSVLVSANLKPIPLPPFDVDDDIYDGTPLLVTGFGTTESGDISDILMTSEVGLIPKKTCVKNYDVPQEYLCASNAGEDNCIGDNGGPLMMFYEKKCYLAGVVSFGPAEKCGTPEPGFYANVFKYMKWIKTNMEI